MNTPFAKQIPVFDLYGEASGLPDLLHVRAIEERAAPLDMIIRVHNIPRFGSSWIAEARDPRILTAARTGWPGYPASSCRACGTQRVSVFDEKAATASC